MFVKIGAWILTKAIPVFSKEAWKRFKNRCQHSKNAAHDYDTPYKKRHGQLQAFCVGMEAQRSLDDIYVTVQFLEERRGAKYRPIEEVEKAFRESSRRLSTSTSDKRQGGMRIATNEQYLMVLGGPGVGKSTFLRKVGFEALKGEDGDFEHESTPVFLELKRFTEDPIDIKAWIAEEFKICGHPYPEQWTRSKLEAGKLLILFDGLDEVPKPNLNNVINKIRDFVHQYSPNRFIVSCRAAAYTGGFADFTVVEIADFDGLQIQDYINTWFASPSNQKTKTAQRCWQTLNTSDHQATKALAQNPLSLALLCTIYEDTQNFPSSQAILYEKIMDIFLKKWAAEKGVHRDLPISRYLASPTVKALLSEIAAVNFKANRLVFSENELINQIQEFYQRRTDTSSGFDASGVLDAIFVDPGLFVERTNGNYSFFHLTFQEYLTANHIAGDTLLIKNLVNQHLYDERWREVFLLTAGLMREADDLLVAMEAEAAKCIKTDGIKAFLQWVEQITDTTDSQYSGYAKRAFALCQYLLLKLLNKIHERVKCKTKQSQDFYPTSHPKVYSNLYYDLYRDLCPSLCFDPNRNPRPNLPRNLHLYFNEVRYLVFALFLYHDFYRYMDAAFHSSDSFKFGDSFDIELSERIKVVKRMKGAKIFRGVDLDRMVQRFNEEREFIKAAGEGKSVKPPAESIHDTWLSVLGITEDMLTISDEKLEHYRQYLRAAEFIIACKEASGRVSPKAWQKIEAKLLTLGT